MNKILIGVPSGEFPRMHGFQNSLDQLIKPDVTLLMRAHGQSPAKNRNEIIKSAIANDCTHILFLDDDVTFEPDLLTRLLAHDKDVVTALYLHRNYPHLPIVFDAAFENQECKYVGLTPDKRGLQPIVNCGFGGVLIKIKVFKLLWPPWITLGQIKADEWCDDVPFFNRVRNARFEMFCDFDAILGHFHHLILRPVYTNNQWMISYVNNTGEAITFPAHIPTQEDIEKELKEKGLK